ncbi:MAG: methyltransferase domain-containing protein [Thermoanaerobaculia bacterium]
MATKTPQRAAFSDAGALARELVDKLEAMSTAVPMTSASSSAGSHAPPGRFRFELAGPREMLENAARFVAPRLPADAGLRRAKALLLRVLRIVTRDQTAFNSVLVETLRSALHEVEQGAVRIDGALLAESDARVRGVAGIDQRLEQDAETARQLTEALAEAARMRSLGLAERAALAADVVSTQKRIDLLEQDRDARAERLARTLEEAAESRLRFEQDARFLNDQLRTMRLELTSLRQGLRTRGSEAGPVSPASVDAVSPIVRPGTGSMDPSDPLRAGLYAHFEDRFRGSEEEILHRQQADVEQFRGAPGPVADLGCGRGEFVQALLAEGIPAVGCDANPVMAQRAREKGLPVDTQDLFSWLDARPDDSLGGVTAYQVVEHLPPSALFDLVELAVSKLAVGGRLLFETINPESVYAMRWFWMDLTHVRPVPAPSLEQLMVESGLRDVRIHFRSPVPAHESVSDEVAGPLALTPITRLLFGPQDYAITGTK